jgi:hypothetical protein
VIVSVAPRDDDNVTVAPGIGLLFPSRTVIVIALVDVPFAVTVVGAAATLLLAADGDPTVNVTVSVCVTFTEPLTTALITAFPRVSEETVPVICPDPFVVPTGCVIVSVTPRDDDRLTVAPCTVLLLASRTVTVIVEVADPSATTLVGLAETVVVVPDGAPAVNVTEAVCVTVTAPLT